MVVVFIESRLKVDSPVPTEKEETHAYSVIRLEVDSTP